MEIEIEQVSSYSTIFELLNSTNHHFNDIIYFRDHPTTIKRRFFSVFVMMLLAPIFVQFFFTKETLDQGDLFTQMGLRWSGIIPATFGPLFLTAVLFLGPLTMQFYSGVYRIYTGINGGIVTFVCHFCLHDLVCISIFLQCIYKKYFDLI